MVKRADRHHAGVSDASENVERSFVVARDIVGGYADPARPKGGLGKPCKKARRLAAQLDISVRSARLCPRTLS